MSSIALNFAIANAFTNSAFGGNPAAVVFLRQDLPDEMLLKIANNFNQPITSFVYSRKSKPMDSTSTEAYFRLRWFTTKTEVQVCGHATLAASKVLFDHGELMLPLTERIVFETKQGNIIASRAKGDTVELHMPSSEVKPVGERERARIAKVISRALGKENVDVKFIGISEKFKGYVLIELDREEDLKNRSISKALLSQTEPYVINILTHASSEAGVAWETRMFAPSIGIQEDQVCGSANCLLAPYWAKKRGVKSGTEMVARQLSERGGTIWVTLDDQMERVKLRGNAIIVAEGKLYLDAP